MHACVNSGSVEDTACARALRFHVPVARKENWGALEDNNKLYFLPRFLLNHNITVYLPKSKNKLSVLVNKNADIIYL